eukprot:CAMPEP_0178900898 /NCGR_PEP_ID=MMETSP0786-20121207/3720_1 /TAXON_ID=186022 /ORGANISM="Thalassionema frauenfeldii, Strain CCMP 1798" /LENGTH=400 /DNA_ID=CAMNT_0020571935 /DNA_START=129 /DNA_END=1331 /DNA_ORIENTATION=+
MTFIGTKENRKGSIRGYNYRRKSIAVMVGILTILMISTISFLLISPKRRNVTNENKRKLSFKRKESQNGNTGYIVDQPIRSIEYGGPQKSTPLVMIRDALDEAVHQRFLQEHLYSCLEAELNQISELDNRVNFPVYIYEGYYHSLPTNETVFSKNPNPMIGKDFMKPAASPFTRAFFDAFRFVNREIFNTLKLNLLQASSYHRCTNGKTASDEAHMTRKGEDVCYLLAKWIDHGCHFGDLSIQIHYGEGNEEKLKSGAAWHMDAENSLLHLAVTLRGNRVLHSMRIQQPMKNNNINGNHVRPPAATLKEILEPQKPGDVYLSSSTLMQHAPHFGKCDYSTRVIAIHARILYTSADINYFRKVKTKESWQKLTSVLAETLALANLQMPSLAQVESRLALLS